MKLKRLARIVSLLIPLVLVGTLIFSIVISQKHWNKTESITSNENLSPKAKTMLSHLPLTFIENQGQWNTKAQFVAKKRGMSIQFEKDGFTLNRSKSIDNQVKTEVIRMTFEGASEQVTLKGAQEQTGKYNYFIGNDHSRWRKNVAGYAQVIYHNLYKGIDLCFYEKKGGLEYDLLLSPGADLSDIKIRVEGLKELRIDENGILIMETEFGPITQSPTKAWYKQTSGENLPVACHFRKIDEHSYGFYVLESNPELSLVIDPGLEWSTFLGGSGSDEVLAMAVNALGNIIVVGYTNSANFPKTPDVYDTTYNGGETDGYVACLSADGSQLLWSTYLGGSDALLDILFDVALDDSGFVTVTGLTSSPDFPITPAAYDTSYNGGYDAIITRLNANGSQLIYSTFLGSSEDDWALALELNSSGEAFVGGYTMSANFPTTPGAYDTSYNGGTADAFVTRLNADGSNLIYSTFLGGSNIEGWEVQFYVVNSRVMGLTLDNSGDLIVTGFTMSNDFPTTPSAYDTSYNGGSDMFVLRLDATGSDLIYSTFLGGSGSDGSFSSEIGLDASGNVSIGGWTESSNFPTTPGAYDTTYNGSVDIFVARLDPTGSNLLYSTYIGGPGWDDTDGCILDASGNVVITGSCQEGFPTTPGAYDTTYNGGIQDAYISRLSLGGNGQADMLYSTFLGGSTLWDWGNVLALIADSTVVVAGMTQSADFPTTPGAYDTTFNDGIDGFICRLGVYVGIQEETSEKLGSSITLSPVYPNPTFGRFSYKLNLPQATQVKVSLFDITGRLIETLIDRQLSAGSHNFTWTPEQELANGIYYLRLDTENEQQSRKFIVMK